MFVSDHERIWMLRQLYGQRIHKDKLIRKFTNHGITSLLPYFNGIAALFERSADKPVIARKLIRALEARVNRQIDLPDAILASPSFPALENTLLPLLVQSIADETLSTLEQGARVSVRADSATSSIPPGSEGFIVESLEAAAKVKFYACAGRYGVEMPPLEIPAAELQLVSLELLLARHQGINAVARYFFNDALLRSMKSSLDSAIYTFAAHRAVQILVDEGFLRIDGDECVGVLDPIFSVLAPRFDAAYKDPDLFSTATLSAPPSERKAHVLRLELTRGCDYNRCTFCSEYTDMPAKTKSLDKFQEHVDRVSASIGAEASRIQRLFIGSGNSLGVATGDLLAALAYARSTFSPQRISLYGRTVSILEKSLAELKQLKEAGLSMVYWGLETGSDEILQYIGKDCSCSDMIAASQRLAAAEIETSAMLMPGVGGRKFSDQHVAGTLELLHNIEINYLTLLSINPDENSPYAKHMEAESDNRPLTPDEVNAQVYKLLQGLTPSGLQIGMFTEEIDQASSNTKRFNCSFTPAIKELLLREFWN